MAILWNSGWCFCWLFSCGKLDHSLSFYTKTLLMTLLCVAFLMVVMETYKKTKKNHPLPLPEYLRVPDDKQVIYLMWPQVIGIFPRKHVIGIEMSRQYYWSSIKCCWFAEKETDILLRNFFPNPQEQKIKVGMVICPLILKSVFKHAQLALSTLSPKFYS